VKTVSTLFSLVDRPCKPYQMDQVSKEDGQGGPACKQLDRLANNWTRSGTEKPHHIGCSGGASSIILHANSSMLDVAGR